MFLKPCSSEGSVCTRNSFLKNRVYIGFAKIKSTILSQLLCMCPRLWCSSGIVIRFLFCFLLLILHFFAWFFVMFILNAICSYALLGFRPLLRLLLIYFQARICTVPLHGSLAVLNTFICSKCSGWSSSVLSLLIFSKVKD